MALELRLQLFSRIFNLRDHCPEDIGQEDWDLAVGDLLDGYLSVYSDLDEIPDARLAAILDEVDAVHRESARAESLLRIWDQVVRNADENHCSWLACWDCLNVAVDSKDLACQAARSSRIEVSFREVAGVVRARTGNSGVWPVNAATPPITWVFSALVSTRGGNKAGSCCM
jgi:hypothetical protein